MQAFTFFYIIIIHVVDFLLLITCFYPISQRWGYQAFTFLDDSYIHGKKKKCTVMN